MSQLRNDIPSLPLFETFPTQQARMAPDNPASWATYKRYADKQLQEGSSELWPKDPEKRAQNIQAVHALSAAGEYKQARSLTDTLHALRQECSYDGELLDLQLDYWRAYLALVEAEPEKTQSILDTVATSELCNQPNIALDAQEYELKTDFLSLQALLSLYQGDFAAAEQQQEYILWVLRDKFAINHPKVLAMQSRLAQTLRLQGWHTPARKLSTETANQLDELPGYGPDHILTIQNRFYAAIDKLADDGSLDVMAELGRIVIHQRKKYPRHTSTFLMLKDLAVAELYYNAKTRHISNPNSLQFHFHERIFRHFDQALAGLTEKGYDKPESIAESHPEAVQTLQVMAMRNLDVAHLSQLAMAQTPKHQSSSAYYDFAIEDFAFAVSMVAVQKKEKEKFILYRTSVRKPDTPLPRLARRLVI
jgi:hypothetical protein